MNTIESWVKEFNESKHDEKCYKFISETHAIMQDLSNWMKKEVASCGLGTFENSITPIFNRVVQVRQNFAAAEFISKAPLTITGVTNGDTEQQWTLSKSFDEKFQTKDEKQKFLDLYFQSQEYISYYKDINIFCDYVLSVELKIKQMDFIKTCLWKSNIVKIYEKAQDLFASIINDPDTINNINVLKLHIELFSKYKELNASQNLDQGTDHIFDTLENIGKSQTNQKRLEEIDEWLTALSQHSKFNNYNAILSQHSKFDNYYAIHSQYSFDYQNIKKELTKSSFPSMINKIFQKIRNRYKECLDEKLKFKHETDTKFFQAYTPVQQVSTEIRNKLVDLEKHFVQVLHFEKIKYLFILLLVKKISQVVQREAFYERYRGRYMHVFNAFQRNTKNILNWGIKDVDPGNFTEKDVFSHQKLWVEESCLNDIDKAKNELCKELFSAIFKYESSKYLLLLSTIRKIREIICDNNIQNELKFLKNG